MWGLIRKTLKQEGLLEQTLIFLIGDNGAPLKIHKHDAPGGGPGWDGSLNEPLNGEKGMLTEGGIRVPFVVSWPGTIAGGKDYQHPVWSLDVAATAVALAELPADPKLDGVNLIPYLTGENEKPPHERLHWRWVAQSAIREGDWKLLIGGPREYLYDLSKDKEEKQNLITDHPEIAKQLRSKLKSWTQELQPPGLATKPVAETWNNYFDFYLEGKPAPPLRPNTDKKSSSAPKQRDPKNIYQQRDRNQDGQLTLAELIGDPKTRNVPALTKRFRLLDKNNDDVLTLKEWLSN